MQTLPNRPSAFASCHAPSLTPRRLLCSARSYPGRRRRVISPSAPNGARSRPPYNYHPADSAYIQVPLSAHTWLSLVSAGNGGDQGAGRVEAASCRCCCCCNGCVCCCCRRSSSPAFLFFVHRNRNLLPIPARVFVLCTVTTTCFGGSGDCAGCNGSGGFSGSIPCSSFSSQCLFSS